MRLSDSTICDIPKTIKYANSDSSPFNSDESLSEDKSSQDNHTPSQLPKPLIPPTTPNYNTDLPSKNNSLTKMNDNPPFKKRIKNPQNNPHIDRSRHQYQNQSILPNPLSKEPQTLNITIIA